MVKSSIWAYLIVSNNDVLTLDTDILTLCDR
jgi:hypothetical protein